MYKSQYKAKENGETCEIYYPKSKKKKKNECLKMTTSKSFYLIGAVVLIVLIVALIITIVYLCNYENYDTIVDVKNEDVLEEANTTDNKNLIIFITYDGFLAYNLTSKKSEILKEASFIAAFDVLNKILFWTDDYSSTIYSNSAKYPKIEYPKRCKPTSIAVDYITNKIYIADNSTGTITVLDMDRKYYAVLVTNLKNLSDLILDQMEGYLFVLEYERSILRFDMDGKSMKKIKESNGISAMTIDRSTKIIYWAISGIRIEASDYEGNNVIEIMPILRNFNSLAILNGMLFMPELLDDITSDGLIPDKQWNVRLWNCKLYNKRCNKLTSDWISFPKPVTSLQNRRIIGTSMDDQGSRLNHCKIDNGGCQQLCLLNSKDHHTCACNVGYSLDFQKCSKLTKLMIYIQGEFIRSTKENFDDAMIPLRYNVESLTCKNSIDFDYDLQRNHLFFSDDNNVYFVNLNSDKGQVRLFSVNRDYYCIRDIALDPRTKLLYYVKESRNSKNNHSINVYHNHIYNKTILTVKYISDLQYHGCPYSLTLHNNNNVLFYTLFNGSSSYDLQSISKTGTNLTFISRLRYYNDKKILAIDYTGKKLYWIYDKYDKEIKYANFDGSNENSFKVSAMKNTIIQSISIQEQWLYVSDEKSIWKCDKTTGANATKIMPTINDEFDENLYKMQTYMLRLIIL